MVTALVVFVVLCFPIQHRRSQIEGFRHSLNTQGQTISQTIALGLQYDDYEAISLAFDLAREDQSLMNIIVLDSEGDLVIASHPENVEINLKDYNVPGLTESEISLTHVSKITADDELYGYGGLQPGQ